MANRAYVIQEISLRDMIGQCELMQDSILQMFRMAEEHEHNAGVALPADYTTHRIALNRLVEYVRTQLQGRIDNGERELVEYTTVYDHALGRKTVQV